MDVIAKIRQNISILHFLDNVKPVRNQGWYIARCPFHQDIQDPQSKRKFWVDNRPGRGICGCFVPRCQGNTPGGKPMDVINFYARLKGITNSEAIRELGRMLK